MLLEARLLTGEPNRAHWPPHRNTLVVMAASADLDRLIEYLIHTLFLTAPERGVPYTGGTGVEAQGDDFTCVSAELEPIHNPRNCRLWRGPDCRCREGPGNQYSRELSPETGYEKANSQLVLSKQ